MTHDELIEAGGMAIFEVSPDRKAGAWLEAHFQTRAKYRDLARAAIRVIAPAVLDEATNLADGHLPLGYMSERERSYCNEHGEEIAHAIRAMKTRYEQ